MSQWIEPAHAKINLVLDVGKRRADGYHDIHSIMQSLALRDTLVLQDRPAGITVSCVSSDPLSQGAEAFVGHTDCEHYISIPKDNRNLAWQAAYHLIKAVGIKRGLYIHINKAIPVAAGLAGGSTDAAAVLRGLNGLWRLGLSPAELAQIGVKVGADVPFCLREGTAEVRGRGEEVHPLTPPPAWPVILLKPPVSVSTAMCYSDYDKLPHPVRINVENLQQALINSNFTGVAESLGNSLEAVTLRRFPQVARWKNYLMEAGCNGVLMSGSGPTLFGLVANATKAREVFQVVARRVRQEPPRQMPNVYLTRLWAPVL